MSNLSTWGSMVVSGNNQDYWAESNGNCKGSQEYSALDVYLGKDETHEQVALGLETCNKKKATRSHKDKMKGDIEELEKDLPK